MLETNKRLQGQVCLLIGVLIVAFSFLMILWVVNINLINNALETIATMHRQTYTPYLTMVTSTVLIIMFGVVLILGAACISIGISLILESYKGTVKKSLIRIHSFFLCNVFRVLVKNSSVLRILVLKKVFLEAD